MASFGGALGAANFQEPSSPDQTSAPQMPNQQQLAPQTAQGQSLAQALMNRKKKGLIGPTMRTPSTLAAAISKSKRARVGGDKYGS
jgi:hypothetical protein